MEQQPVEQKSRYAKNRWIKLISNFMFVGVALFTGAAIVHGTVVQSCLVKNESFVAGVLPADMRGQQGSAQSADTIDVSKCTQDSDTEMKAGDLPNTPSIAGSASQPEPKAVQPQQVPAQPQQAPVQPEQQKTVSETVKPQPVQAAQSAAVPTMTSAPAPTPAPIVAQVQPAPVAKPQPAKAVTPKAKPATPAKVQSTKTTSVDLDKLSMAVAMQETHNCQDKQGSALVNNCHGFKRNGQFIKFNSPEESHAYFKQLWAKSYKIFPTRRLAQIYSGNDNPTQWLNNVTYYYNRL